VIETSTHVVLVFVEKLTKFTSSLNPVKQLPKKPKFEWFLKMSILSLCAKIWHWFPISGAMAQIYGMCTKF